jgi:hypothetical protein
MASGMDSTKAQAVLSATVGKASLTAWSGTTGKIKLMSTAANETTDGTEISGGSYVAGGVATGTLTSVWGSATYSSGVASITNSGAAITQTNMPTTAVVSASLYDTAPSRWWWGDLTTNVTTNLGDTLTFATSSIVMQFNV